MENIIVIGSSGHAKVVIDIIEKQGKYHIIGLIDRFRRIGDDTFGYAVLGKEEDIPDLVEKHNIQACIIAVGDNWVRYRIYSNICFIYPRMRFITAVHPSAQIGKNVKIGMGSVVMPGVVINSNVQIGDFCILNTNSSIDHDGVMGDFSSLAPNAALGGNVSIGKFTAVAISATVSHKICIGRNVVIGASSLVLKDIPDDKVAYGIPASIIRDRSEGEPYL